MPGSLSLAIGTKTVTLNLKLTNAELNAIVKRHAIRRGIAVEELTQDQIGVDVLKSLARYMRDNSIDQQRIEKQTELLANVEAQISAENDLFDEPAPPPP